MEDGRWEINYGLPTIRASGLEIVPATGNNSRMTVTADDRKRVVLPAAEPGDRFDLQTSGEGTFILRRLEPAQRSPAKLVKPIPYKGAWLMPGEVDMEKLV